MVDTEETLTDEHRAHIQELNVAIQDFNEFLGAANRSEEIETLGPFLGDFEVSEVVARVAEHRLDFQRTCNGIRDCAEREDVLDVLEAWEDALSSQYEGLMEVL